MPVRGGEPAGCAADRRSLAWLLVLCAVPMLGVAGLRFALHLPAGDEPHYLIISEALARYHSLDVQRVYDHRDYAAFFVPPIEPHTAPGPSGHPLPLHSIGGPVLWLVPFLVAGRAGVMAFMVAVSLLVVANVYLLILNLGTSGRTAFLTGAAVGLGTPVLTYSSLVFVEPIGALGCVYALRVLLAPRLRTADLLTVSTALGVLPWVHSRFLLFPPVFLALLLRRLWREDGGVRRVGYAVGPALALFLALELYVVVVWHTLDPAPNQTSAGAVPFRIDPLPALAGIAFDQHTGFVPNFPVLLLLLPGVLAAVSTAASASSGWRALHVPVAAVVVPYTVVVCSFLAWPGAWAPPARFMAVVLPMLACYVAVALDRVPGLVVPAGVAVLYSAVSTVWAVCTPDGGFSAQRGDSSGLVLGTWAVVAIAVAVAVRVPSSRSPVSPVGQRAEPSA